MRGSGLSHSLRRVKRIMKASLQEKEHCLGQFVFIYYAKSPDFGVAAPGAATRAAGRRIA